MHIVFHIRDISGQSLVFIKYPFDEYAIYTKEGLISRRFTKEKLENIAKQHGAQIEIRELTPISYIAILRKSLNHQCLTYWNAR